MSPPAAQAPPQLPGLAFSSSLGAGGYSDVFLYEQQMPRRKVAVKVLKDVGLTDTLRAQFTAEANAMAELADHPNIVPVFAADVAADGRPYIVMMYYPRPNLGVRAASEHFAVSDVLRIGIQIASAVETAHRAGILHRDIKPANILTSQYGAPGLTDFGIAAQLAAVDDDDDAGVSVPWSPPEVLYATATASVRSDVYSLGATLWHLLVGRSPFEIVGGDNSPYALMRRSRDLAVPSTGRTDVATSLDRLLRQSMSKDPIARPACAFDFARALQAVEQEQRLPRTEIVVLTEEKPSGRDRNESSSGAEATRRRAPVRVDAQPPRPIGRPPVNRAWAPQAASGAPVAGHPPVAAPPIAPALPPIAAAPVGGVPPPLLAEPPAVSRPPGVGPRSPRSRSARERAVEPREKPLSATVHRPVTAGVAQPVEQIDRRRRVRLPLVLAAIAGVLVLAVVLGVIFTSGHTKGAATTAATSRQDVGNPDDVASPGPIGITAVKVDANTLRFTWRYSNALGSDTFLWQVQDASKSGKVNAPALDLPDQGGARLCLQVKVVRADSTHATVGWPFTGCGP